MVGRLSRALSVELQRIVAKLKRRERIYLITLCGIRPEARAG